MLGSELCLHGEDLLEKPVIERHIIRIGAQEGHGGVGVGVLETGHQKVAVKVDLPLKGGHLILFGAYIANAAAIDPDFVVTQADSALKAQQLSVVKAYHLFSSQSS